MTRTVPGREGGAAPDRANRPGRAGDAGAVAGGRGGARGRVRGCAAPAGRRGPPPAGSPRRPAAERWLMSSSATSRQRQAALVTGAATVIGKAIAATLADRHAADAARPGRADRRTGAHRRPGVTRTCPAGAASSARGWRRPDSTLAAAVGRVEDSVSRRSWSRWNSPRTAAAGAAATLWARGSCSAPPVHHTGSSSRSSPSCRSLWSDCLTQTLARHSSAETAVRFAKGRSGLCLTRVGVGTFRHGPGG
jgi:hypothetical protein